MSSEISSYASASSDGNSSPMPDQFTHVQSHTDFDKTRIDNLTYYYPNSNVSSFPSCLGTKDCNTSIILSHSNTVATCKSSAKTDAFGVSSDKPVPSGCAIYYYEASILCDGVDGHIAVGFGNADSNNLLPGWNAKSIGYHADDGFVFTSTHKRYGPGYKCGDVVGCGVNFVTNRFFFTQNGYFYGYFNQSSLNLELTNFYVLLGMQSVRESVSINFGQERFVFDLKSFIGSEEASLSNKIDKLQAVDVNIMCRMIVEYLVYNGYYKTAVAFGKMVALDVQFDPSLFRFSQDLKDLITCGDMHSAIEKCEERFPEIFEDNPTVYFRMKIQSFVELVMFYHKDLCPPNTLTTFVDPDCNVHHNDSHNGVEDVEMRDSERHNLAEESSVRLIMYARELYELCNRLFSTKFDEYKSNEELLFKAVSLVEFDNPWKSVYGQSLMTASSRNDIFSTINSIILESFGSKKIPSITIARNHLKKCVELMRRVNVPESYLISI